MAVLRRRTCRQDAGAWNPNEAAGARQQNGFFPHEPPFARSDLLQKHRARHHFLQGS